VGNGGHDGISPLISQLSIERMAIDVAAKHLLETDVDSAKRLSTHLSPLPVRETLINELRVEKRMLVDWHVRYAQDALRQGGWDPNWLVTRLRFTEDAEETKAIAEATGGAPQGLLKLARGAETFFHEAMELVDLPPEDFRSAWRDLRRKASAENPLVDVSTNMELLLANLIEAATRRVLLKAAIAVVHDGPQALKDFKAPYSNGPIEYREVKGGFELTSPLQFTAKALKLAFGQP